VLTVVVENVVGLESAKISSTPNPHNLLNFIISCGLKSTAINIIKEATINVTFCYQYFIPL